MRYVVLIVRCRATYDARKWTYWHADSGLPAHPDNLANDVLDLREESEDIDLLNSGSDREGKSGDGGGFSGTLLSGNGHHSSSPHAASDRDEASQNGTKACLACTFDNPLDEPLCTMCKTPFES